MDPPLEVAHNWRQTLGAMIARNFLETDNNILYPRIDITGEKTGITGFIKELIPKRKLATEEEIGRAVEMAENEMIENGIVAVGDISNGNITFSQKRKGKMLYHTFIEVFDLNSDNPQEVFLNALNLKSQISNLKSSIVPHAPYSVSSKLLELISEEAAKSKNIVSIHNQESDGERELFVSRSGPIFDLYSKMGMNMEKIERTGQNSLRSTLSKLSGAEKLLLVHNTYTSQEDIQWAKSNDPGLKTKNLFWCTCPNANIFIENKLPNYNHFIKENAKLTIGTDSLASNWSLSVLAELKTIQTHFPDISLEKLLRWATKNGSEFLGFDQLGTIEKGKRPGLNLLTNIANMQLTEKTEVQKLI